MYLPMMMCGCDLISKVLLLLLLLLLLCVQSTAGRYLPVGSTLYLPMPNVA